MSILDDMHAAYHEVSNAGKLTVRAHWRMGPYSRQALTADLVGRGEMSAAEASRLVSLYGLPIQAGHDMLGFELAQEGPIMRSLGPVNEAGPAPPAA